MKRRVVYCFYLVCAVLFNSVSCDSTFDMRRSLVNEPVFECATSKDSKCDPKNNACSYAIKCEREKGFELACYVTWSNDSRVKIESQGCWLAQIDSPSGCPDERCIATSTLSNSSPKPNEPDKYFCCCSKPMCNENFEFIPTPTTPSSSMEQESMTSPGNDSDVTAGLTYALAPIIVMAFFVLFVYYVYRRYTLYQMAKRFPDSINGKGFALRVPPSPTTPLKPIQIIEEVSKGRYGSVYKARMCDQIVAVKIFPAQEVDSWVQEQEIYTTPCMRQNSYILRFLAAEVRGTDIKAEYWLITAFMENGSLYDYLKAHTVTFPELLHISVTMLRGLAFLHEECMATMDQAYKPTIVHRDFKSKNVLLKSDLTACVADFGLAVKCVHGRTPSDVHGQVGTRRYMPPEVLEGATEFSAFAFRQIDVYACGLVLWEILSRCSFRGEKVDDYRLPFEEVGIRPTLGELQEHVVNKKQRPVLRKSWRQHPQGHVVCSTIEEMWDTEPEARITAGCGLERLAALQPTLSTMQNGFPDNNANMETSPLITDFQTLSDLNMGSSNV